jgi:hypothetical protein
MECVYQLVLQFPEAFEFGESFLQTILFHAYSCLFGTFLFDCESERVRERTAATTQSLWTHILEHRSNFARNGPTAPEEDVRERVPSAVVDDDGADETNVDQVKDSEDKAGGPHPVLRPNAKDVRLWLPAHFPLLELDS